MSFDQSGSTTEERRLDAERLVAELDSSERLVLTGFVKGMSRQAIAAASEQGLEDLERTLASLMKKLNAGTVADAVRIGLYAQVDRPD